MKQPSLQLLLRSLQNGWFVTLPLLLLFLSDRQVVILDFGIFHMPFCCLMLMNQYFSVTANEFGHQISGEESQNYWLALFLCVFTSYTQNLIYLLCILSEYVQPPFLNIIFNLHQVLSKLCKQPIVVYIPEHEVCFSHDLFGMTF